MAGDDRLSDLLYDGETIREQVTFGSTTIAVTSHRLLVFTPEGDGANLRAVDRPNVERIDRQTTGNTTHLKRGLKAGIFGVALVGLGWAVNLDALLPSLDGFAGTGTGMDGLLSTVRAAFALIRLLDDVLVVGGASVLAAAAALVLGYVRTREDVLVISVAGGQDITLPAPAGAGTVTRLRTALEQNGNTQVSVANTGAPQTGQQSDTEPTETVTFEDLTADHESGRDA